MPKNNNANVAQYEDEIDDSFEDARRQKNVSFYFSPEQLAKHYAIEAHEKKMKARADYQMDLESSDDESEISTILEDSFELPDDESYASSIFSDDFDFEDWDDAVDHETRIREAVAKLKDELIKQLKASPFSAVKKQFKNEVKDFGIQIFDAKQTASTQNHYRAHLYSLRADLNKDLNTLSDIIAKTIRTFSLLNNFKGPHDDFFKNTSAPRLQRTINDVYARLDTVVPQSNDTNSIQKLHQQLRNIREGILILKGAMLTEINTVAELQGPHADAVNEIFGVIAFDMNPLEKQEALDIFNDYKMTIHFNEPKSKDKSADALRTTLFNRRTTLNEYLASLKRDLMEFINTHQISDDLDNAETKFFSSATASRLINTLDSVQKNLDKNMVTDNLGIEYKLNTQIKNIAEAILTIKGAVISEVGTLNSLRATDGKANIKWTALLADLDRDGVNLACKLYDKFKVQCTLDESIDQMSNGTNASNAGLYKERAHLNAQLMSFKTELNQLHEQYVNQKKVAASNNLNRFFGTGTAADTNRAAAIERMKATAEAVVAQLDEIKPELADMSPETKLNAQINSLNAGIQVIKGAVINEFDKIQGTIFSAERSSLYQVLDKNYGLSKMSSKEKASALKALESFEKSQAEVEHASTLTA